MTMATSAAALVVMMTFAAFFLAIVAVAASMMVPTTACQMLDQVLDLFVGSIAILNHGSYEVEYLACKRVVGVDSHTVFLDLLDFCHKLMVLIVHQGDNGVLEDILMVEMTVDHEYVAPQLVHTLGLIISKSL